jgi:NitT/TauT family transport system permease protein
VVDLSPYLFTGCKIAITFAVIGAVISEFVAAQDGLGYLILISTAQSQTPLAFAAIILLTLISVVLFYAVEFIERRSVTWAP